jgi:hypothetical protein
MEIASQFEKASDQDRENIANRYSSLISGVKELWYSPTLIDVIRICHLGGIDTLPKDTLVSLDDRDHARQRRFIESDGDRIDEAYRDFNQFHDFIGDLLSRKSHFHKERWDFLKSDYPDADALGKLRYIIRLAKINGTGNNYLFGFDEPGKEKAILFGYDERVFNQQTAYDIMPCELVYMLRDGTVLRGDGTNVSVQLLWDCLQNIVTKRAFAGHDERLQKYVTAHEKFYPGDPYWASCDRCSGAAICHSGADESFPAGAPAEQYAYCDGSDKWQKVGAWRVGDSSDMLQPGDVLITLGDHIKIFVGNETVQKKFPGSDANMYSGSAGQHQPWCYNESTSYDYRTYEVFRYVGAS